MFERMRRRPKLRILRATQHKWPDEVQTTSILASYSPTTSKVSWKTSFGHFFQVQKMDKSNRNINQTRQVTNCIEVTNLSIELQALKLSLSYGCTPIHFSAFMLYGTPWDIGRFIVLKTKILSLMFKMLSWIASKLLLTCV